MKSEALLKIYMSVTRPPKPKYPPTRKVYNVALYG